MAFFPSRATNSQPISELNDKAQDVQIDFTRINWHCWFRFMFRGLENAQNTLSSNPPGNTSPKEIPVYGNNLLCCSPLLRLQPIRQINDVLIQHPNELKNRSNFYDQVCVDLCYHNSDIHSIAHWIPFVSNTDSSFLNGFNIFCQSPYQWDRYNFHNRGPASVTLWLM